MSVDWKVHTYAELPSTQEYVREIAEEGLEEGIVVQALTQSRGRGRQGRTWDSPMGNLYMSLLLRPDCPVREAGQIAFVVPLAISDAMDIYLEDGVEKKLKWPNDILLNGKKSAGILIETVMGKGGKIEALVIGMGVNILSAPEGATFVAAHAGDRQVAIHPFRDAVLAALKFRYDVWQQHGFEPIRKEWLARAYKLGGKIRATHPEGEYEGIFRDLDKDGALVLELSDGSEKRLHAGEVILE